MSELSVKPPRIAQQGRGSTHTAYLITSGDPGWQRVRAALSRLPEIRVLGESTGRAGAVTEVARLQPDLIMLPMPTGGAVAQTLLQRIAAQCPTSRLVLIAETMPHAALRALSGTHVHGYLLWDEVHPATMGSFLVSVFGGFVPCSLAVSDLLHTVPARIAAKQATAVSARARAVLDGLAARKTYRQIAATEQVSVRTIKRSVQDLQDTLDAPTLFLLGREVTKRDLLP